MVLFVGPIVVVLLPIMAVGQEKKERPRLVAQIGHAPAQSDDIFAMKISGDGKWLASGSFFGTVVIWEVASGRQLRSFKAAPLPILALSHDGRRLATAGGQDRVVKMWDVASGRLLKEMAGPGKGEGVSSLAMSRDGAWIAIDMGEKSVQVWDAASGKNIRACAGSRPKLSEDGSRLLTVGDGKVNVWQRSTGKLLRDFPAGRWPSATMASAW
jgi:WD40 repeat protein